MGEQPTSQLDPVSTTREGVTVERRLELEAPGIVVIETITSQRDAPLRVSVIDYLPGTFAVADIGYHDEYTPESGSVGDDSAVFETVVTGGSPVRVVYGMVLAEGVEVEAIADAQETSPPRIDRIEPAEREGEASDRTFSDMDPAEFFEIAGAESGAATDSVDEGSPADRSILDELAEELSTGEIDEASLETVQQALVSPFGKSTRLRLRRLESRLEEFDVYLEALREIIDEHGTGVEFLDDVRGSIESVEAAVESLRTEVERAAAERDDISDDLAELSELSATVEALDRSVQSLDRLEDELDAVKEETDTLRERIEDWEAVRDRLVEALDVDSGD